MRTLFHWPKAILIVIAALAAPVASLVTAREQAANPPHGVLLFEKEVDTRADGSEVKLPMPRYDGIRIYTADGFVSATLMPHGRKWNVASATRADLPGSVGEGASTAYAGRYEIDRARGTVTHTPIASVDPGDVGRPLTRRFEVEGDGLRLSGNFQHAGEELTFTVYWKRAATKTAGG